MQRPHRPSRSPSPVARRILVPIDFSEAGKPALRYARSLARLTGASLSLMHVIEPAYLGTELAYIPPQGSGARTEAVNKLTAIRTRDFQAIKTDVNVRDGIAFLEIVNEAREIKADLIVLTTHGYTGLRHIVMGSTAEQVVRHAACPVLVVRSKPLARSKTPARRQVA